MCVVMRHIRGELNHWNVGVILCFIAAIGITSSFKTSSLKSSNSSKGIRADDSLKLAVIVGCHGNVAPSFNYAANPYPTSNTTFWPFGPGEVAIEGRNKLYSFGQKVRALYSGFVDTKYSKSDFAAKSPEVDRTTISTQLFTAGLYPPVDYEIWNNSVLWLPILEEIDSSDKTLDVTSCKRFLKEANKSASRFETQYATEISSISTYLTKSTKSQITGIEDIALVWEMLYSQEFEGLNNTSWATESYRSELKNLTGQYYIDYYAGSAEAVKLVIGIFLGQIIEIMENKTKIHEASSAEFYSFKSPVENDLSAIDGSGPVPTDEQTPKMIFFSGYNPSLITLQAALGIPSSKIVSPIAPGSAIILELHEHSETQDYYVQAIFIDGRDPGLNVVVLNIPHCGSPCQFTQFVKNSSVYTNVTDQNYKKQCSS